ncbi:MAG: DUF115 domain-containing protein [Candidatus Bathyarchaeota archaeon]|nr:MAG: DUF115 domain-containing protein [Candidatus Bathyarchaeota archaeon]
MDLKAWWPWYRKIVHAFGYDPKHDQYAADLLSTLLDGVALSLSRFKELISNKTILVFGAGPSLEATLRQLLEYAVLNHFTLISANGATSALLDIAGEAPDIVVTDLDGRIDDLLKANEAGALMAIHGHGDNIHLLKEYVPKFGNVIGTTQRKPRPNVYNFGGFTDGDRAAFLASEMEAKAVVLAGMDFGHEAGPYSKTNTWSIDVKRLKLQWGRQLLEWLSTRTNIPLYNLRSHGENIVGFTNVSAKYLLNLIS